MFKPAQNIMSLLLQNIQIPPPSSTDWHPYPQKTIKSSRYAPPDPPKHIGTLNFSFLLKNRPI